jgi:hypothetical protein
LAGFRHCIFNIIGRKLQCACHFQKTMSADDLARSISLTVEQLRDGLAMFIERSSRVYNTAPCVNHWFAAI